MTSAEDLEKRVAVLEARLKNQAKVIAQTGQHIIQLSVANQKAAIAQLGQKGQELKAMAQPANLPSMQDTDPATGDTATNSDLEELAMELQVQLGLLEERSRCRIVNATATDPEHTLEPLPNVEGELPPNFPGTRADFYALDNTTVLSLCEFYELIDEANPMSTESTGLRLTLAKYISINMR